MRTIETNVYTFDELSEDAKKYAIEHLREQCYISNSEWMWDDANGTIKEVEELANVYADIDESSQGWYVNHAHEKNEDFYDDRDEDVKFEDFRKRYIEQFKEMLWCDNYMLKIVEEYEFDKRRSYASNVAWMIIEFCKQIDDDCMYYFKDDTVEGWIDMNEFEFTESGRLYREQI